jgi:ribosome-associated toxin RatA of RatAB toxin-antitoxin module
MSETSTGKIVIKAAHSKVEDILFEISQYPTWSSAIKSVSILEKDEKGRALSATLAIDAGMMKDRVNTTGAWRPNDLVSR